MIQNQFKKILLFGGDILVLYISLYLALVLRHQQLPSGQEWNLNFWPFTVLFVFWAVALFINGLYEAAASKNDFEFYNKLLGNLFVNFILGAAYFYLLTNKLFDIKPQAIYFIFIGTSLVLFLLWRFWFNNLVQRPNLLRNVLVVGLKDEAKELIEEIIKKPQLGYRITAIVHGGYRNDENWKEVNFYNSTSDIKHILKKHEINTIVTSLDPRTNPELLRGLYESLALRLQFFDLPAFYEKLTGKIPVTTIGHIWFLENLAEGDKGFYELMKRIFDIGIAALGLLLALPLVPMVASLIKLDSPGSTFFVQARVGHLGKIFRAVKFRSMVVGAERNGEPQWAQKNDPRVTRVGKFLRKTRLDEIPQLLNVLRGEMSFVGPRPERPEFVRQLQELIPFYNERHLVKPGMTGWAQINFQYGASAGDALKKLQYDLFYIKNRSLALDVGIALKTLNIILTGRGR